MSEFSKVFLPFLFVILTSVVGFFITEVVRELRSSPLLIYSKELGAETTDLTVRNASNHFIQDTVLQVACPMERHCLEEIKPKQYVERIAGKSIVRSQNSEQAEIEIDLHPRTSASFRVKPVTGRGADVELLYRPDVITPQVVTLLPVGGPTAFMAKHYLEIMSWTFAIAAASAVVLLLMSFIILGVDILRRKEGQAYAQSYVSRPIGQQPIDPSGPGGDHRTGGDQGGGR